MGDIVNLNKARKARNKAQDKAAAAANRAAFGRSRIEKTATARETDRADRLLDGARRDDRDRKD